MFVYLSKLLPLFVYPLGLITILIIVAIVLKQRPKWQRGLLIAALLILLLSSNRWVSALLVKSLEWRNLPPQTTPQAAAIVLLGGGTDPYEAPRPMTEINSAGDRVLYAAKLYREGAAPIILASGGTVNFTPDRVSTPAQDMADLLIFLDVPASAIWQQNKSQNTYEDALFSTELLAEQGIEDIILVTSAIHMPRARALFEAQGLTVIPAPVDYSITEQSWRDLLNPGFDEAVIYALPNVSALNSTTNALKEYLGLLIYGLRGWL
jgi:uncharacterized SAM-binding protein YcdF (DUF218 family)